MGRDFRGFEENFPGTVDSAGEAPREPERKRGRNLLLRFFAWAGGKLVDVAVGDFLPGSNLLGIFVFIAVFGILVIVGAEWVNTPAQDLLAIAGGLVCIGVDLGIRKVCRRRWPEKAPAGARMAFLPLWVCGIFWCISGTIRLALGLFG